MNARLNILILSCGTRNKIVQYFKNELAGLGEVFVTDCSEFAPALYDADKYFIVPRIEDQNYIDVILNICKENRIKAVLSLIDPELSLLAKYKEKFLDI
ncbi:MAG: carbamoyl phosphate synthase, partial [Halanaerobiales bacterium]